MKLLYKILLDKMIADPEDPRHQEYQEGDVWAIDPKGFTNRGKKYGPVRWLVIQNDGISATSSQIVVASITDNTRKPIARDTFVKVRISPTEDNGLTKNSVVDCANICTVNKDHFLSFHGTITPTQMDRVKEKLRNVLTLH